LTNFFADIKVERIISSPYKRAIQTIQPLANQLEIEIEINSQVAERSLSPKPLSDWFEKLKATFEDFDLKYEGGESSHEATDRIAGVLNTVINEGVENTIIVTHGNIMSLLLNYYNKEFGFEDWNKLSNPDIYLLKSEKKEITFERIWS
jgi:2,3-bisphosphoglycerate-dependent phosphoglycerate mutase